MTSYTPEADMHGFPLDFLDTPTPEIVRNLEVRLSRCPVTGLPVSITDPERNGRTCYIATPSRAFTDYALSETRHFADRPGLRKISAGVVRTLAPLVRATRWDNQVQINNWLLATNPIPDLSMAEIGDSVRFHQSRNPGKALILRSLNTAQHSDQMTFLSALSFRLVPNRQVYLWAADRETLRKRDLRRNLTLLEKDDLTWVPGSDFSPDDFEMASALYARLYLDKYTTLNPAYTARFIELFTRDGAMETWGLRRRDGTLCGVVGLVGLGDTLTIPLVGYDTDAPTEAGLYRRLVARGFATARDRGQILNLSAGAAGFKRNRGAKPVIEYLAVRDQDLPRVSRAAGAVVSSAATRIGVPLLSRYEL